MARQQQQSDRFITAREVAELTGLSVGAIYHGEAGTDELLRIRLGRSVRYSYLNVVDWMTKKKQEAQEKREQKPIRLTLIKPVLGKRTIDRLCK